MHDDTTPTAPPAPAAAPPTGRRPRHRKAIAAAVLAILAAATAGWAIHRSRMAARAPAYVTATATVGPIARTVTTTGTINPVLTIIVGSYVSGVIQSISCDFNTQVKKGQVCARIDPRPYQTVVASAQANLANAKAQLAKDQAALAYAKATYQRDVSLAGTGYVSRDTLDAARSAHDEAAAQIVLDRANIASRQAALDTAQVNLGYTDIVSPVDGTVVSRNVTVGQTVAASFQTPTLFLIATDMTRMQVDTNVSETDIGFIRQGQRASFHVESYPDRLFDATVVQVRQAPQTIQNVVTYDVVLGVDNRDQLLKPGMTATARIVVDARASVLRVPDQALRYSPSTVAVPARPHGEKQVWTLVDGRPVAVAVTLGLDDDSFSEVTGGTLKPGQTVIVGERSTTGPAAAGATPRLRL
ncbi:efflux RND transporter periplasmic adaptor subunit [Rhodanobacter aciditrophus]|uniref:efflux RND transporter periplasmic adaptor subunit n=1 Tax=Rhodanobacter aciditrophus TaxID=1623218 RepID=UPI003CFAC450